METGQYYFDKLSEVEQKEFKKNINADPLTVFERYVKQEFIDFYKFISCAFTWHATSQGPGYWANISIRKID